MSGKGTAVFWIGLLLIFANFWVSGQSTIVWDAITGTAAKLPKSPNVKLLPKKPGSPSPID